MSFQIHIFMLAEQILSPTEPFPSSEQRFGRVCATAPENCSLALHGMSCTRTQKGMCCQKNRAGAGLVSGVMVVKKIVLFLQQLLFPVKNRPRSKALFGLLIVVMGPGRS